MFELSESALSLLRLRLSGQRVEVTDETRVPYQELAAAGLAEPVHTFTKGRDSHYRLTLAAMERKAEFLSVSIPGPSREESAA
ncbi:MAG: hypothetical protein ACHRXM_38550 [Isosphaerales bacterium]